MLQFRESNCTDNFAVLGGCMMLTNNAQMQVEGLAGIGSERQGVQSRFANNVAVNGGAIICAACRNVNLREPLFINNTALLVGGAVYVLESHETFSIEQCTFENNVAFRGGAVGVDAAGDVRVSGNLGLVTLFVENRAVAGAALYATANSQRENRLEVVTSVFRQNSAVTTDELLLDSRITGSFDLVVNDDQFQSALEDPSVALRSESVSCGQGGGGGICLALDLLPAGAVADYIIRDSIIEENNAVVGGGIFAAISDNATWNTHENLQARCPDTRLFDSCRALRFVNVTIIQNFASAGAGGLFIHDPEALALQCNLQSSQVSLLQAMQEGSGELDAEETCTEIDRNSVGVGGFGANVGSRVQRLLVSNLFGPLRNHTSGQRLLPECTNDCSLNQTEGILVEVIDHFNQVITEGIQDAELAVNLISDNILGARRYVAEHGVININNTVGIGIGLPSAIVRIEAVQDSSLNAEIEFSTRSCFPGEEPGDIECIVCRPLQYTISPIRQGCRPCEDDATCTGGAALVPNDGKWHSTPFSPQIHDCIIREACSYANRTETLSAFYADRHALDEEVRSLNENIEAGHKPEFPQYNQCAKGYTGILCGSCAPGYGHFAGGECVECSTEQSGSILISTLIAVWLTFFVGINILTTLSSTQRQIRLAMYRIRTAEARQLEMQSRGLTTGPDGQISQPEDVGDDTSGSMDDRITSRIKLTEMLKILVNYLQVTSVALSINLNWMGAIQGLLSVEMAVVGVTSGSHFVPLDCTFNDRDNDTGTPNAIKVLWLRAVFPLILLSFFIISCRIYLQAKRLRMAASNAGRQNASSGAQHFITFKSYCVVIAIVVVFFSYINVTSEFMRTVNCITVDEDSTGHLYDIYAIETGKRVWAEDTSLYCFSGDHTVTGVFGILGLIFFSLAVILFILTWLPLNAQRLGDPAFIAEYGFMYQGYKEEWYVTFWEAVITVRKALISAAVVFAFPLGPNLQGVCALGVLILAIGVHFIFMPFKSFRGHPNVPRYAGIMLRAFKLTSMAEKWVRLNNKISLNALETGSLMMSIIVFYAGILFNDDNASSAGKVTMAVFTFAINMAFVGYMLYRLYYGAHVTINQYCDHLKRVHMEEDIIPDGVGPLSLLRRALAVYRYRSVFVEPVDDQKTTSNRFEEQL